NRGVMKRRLSMRKIFRLIREELCFSFLLGSVPMGLTAVANTKFVPTDYIKQLSPSDYVFWYFCSLFVLHIILSSILKHWGKPTIERRPTTNLLLKRTEQLSAGIHGVFRALAGSLPVGLSVILAEAGFVNGWETVSAFTFGLSGLILIACIVMAFLTESVTDKDLGYDSRSVEVF
ncbi:TPA: hypothetical protein ACVOZG_004626, partial [Vibrio diabolicus]|uniref:hypothetical protein n=1 Tax=Vibrio diabolicus TaxID=50719 RepID=UPI00215F341C